MKRIVLILVSGTFLTRVEPGTVGDPAILAKSGISTTGATSIVGDIGLAPDGHVHAFNTGSVMTGQALAQTAVTLDSTAITGL